jgi:EmrB/QacA subfamily drug resistance transporter
MGEAEIRTTTRSEPADSLHTAAVERHRQLALYVLCAGMLMIVLDTTIVNVALPQIQNDLKFSTGELAWVINSYLIAVGGCLLLAGRLGDIVGRRRMFLAGLVVFTVASTMCGLARSGAVLVAARFVQGLGGAMTSAVILGMIVTLFPAPGEQAKAIGVFAFVASAGGAIGLLAGGVLTQILDWHWIFFVNVPIGLATFLAAVQLVTPDRAHGWGAGADVPGAVLVTSALMTAVYTIVEPAAMHGWTARSTLVAAGVSVTLLAAFVIREHLTANPLVPLGFFANRAVAGANMIQVIGAAGMFGTFFLGSLFLERARGYGPIDIGLAFLPVSVLMGFISIRYAEALTMRFGARRSVVVGLLLIVCALILLSRTPVRGHYLVDLLPAMVLMGVGAGMCFPALTSIAMSEAAGSEAGLASGLINTTGQVGGALGLAVLATVSTERTRGLRAAGHALPAALTGGYHLAFWIAAGLTCAATIVAVTVIPRPREHETGQVTPP